MMNLFFIKKFKTVYVRVISLILIISFIIPSLFFMSAPRSKAFEAVSVIGGIGTIQETLSAVANAATSVSVNSLTVKEYILDPIAFAVAKIIIQHMTESIVNWINSGFQGGPAFVTDFGGFLSDVADEEIGRFIEGSALSFLCDPFEMDIRIALSLRTPFERRISCTLSDVIDNIEGFIGGDFSQGGWEGWFELTTVPQNNPYGAYLASASELEMRIASAQHIETTKLDWGRGFMSWEECEELPPDFVGPPRCEIVTPGVVIEDQLANVLGSGVRQLELADEFNEIINALISQLIIQIFTDRGGLRGTSRSSGGSSSYISRLGGSAGVDALQNNRNNALIEINRVIKDETEYRDAKQNALNAVINAENLLFQLQACYAGKLANSNLNLTAGERTIAQNRISQAASVIASQITPLKNTLQHTIDERNQKLAELNAIRTDVSNATIQAQLQVATDKLVELQKDTGTLTIIDIFNAGQERDSIIGQMGTLNATTQTQISECQAFPPPPISNTE